MADTLAVSSGSYLVVEGGLIHDRQPASHGFIVGTYGSMFFFVQVRSGLTLLC
jgi:hypothetical protein